MKSLLFLPRLFFIYYFLYPIPTLLILATLLTSVIAYMTRSLPVAVLALTLAVLGGLKTFNLRSISRYLVQGSIHPEPKVITNVRAPFVSVGPISLSEPAKNLDLGDRPVNFPFRIRGYFHNIGRKEAKMLRVEMKFPEKIFRLTSGDRNTKIKNLASGDIETYEWTVVPLRKTEKPQSISVRVYWEGGYSEKSLGIRSCFKLSDHPVKTIRIDRWRHGTLAAVAWRADIDGFDNLSNERTLSPALNYGGLFRVAPSIFLSGRLSLDFKQWKSWVSHIPQKFKEKPSQERFEQFLRFLGGIKARNELEYPLIDSSWPCAQIGSHMYYHYYSRYGYDASQDTGWESYVSPGDFHHSWERTDASEKTVLTEIQENIALNNEVIEGFFGVSPTTWSAPADRPHELYAISLERAGIIGSSEACPRKPPRLPSSIAPYRPDLGQVTPYHPEGTRIVETGAHIHRFDPHTVNQVICLKRSVLMAMKNRSQVTFLIHPHLRLPDHFGSRSSEEHFPEILRFLVEDLGSAVWITTHHCIATYWEKILCPEHKVVKSWVENGVIHIENSCNERLLDIPLEIDFEGRKVSCDLVDLLPNSRIQLFS